MKGDDAKMRKYTFNSIRSMGKLTFFGELNGERTDEVREALMVSFDNSHHLLIDITKVTKMDNSCIDLINSTKEKAERLHKHLVVIES